MREAHERERTLMVTRTDSVTPHAGLTGKFLPVDEHDRVVVSVRSFSGVLHSWKVKKGVGGGGNDDDQSRNLVSGRGGTAEGRDSEIQMGMSPEGER